MTYKGMAHNLSMLPEATSARHARVCSRVLESARACSSLLARARELRWRLGSPESRCVRLSSKWVFLI